ncbi:MAG: IS110 family transposase, partial [Rhodothermaceae bacterium]
ENNTDGYSVLEELLNSLSLKPTELVLLLEATGIYGEELCYYFSAKDYNVSVEAPHKIKNSIKDSPRKNDFLDAERIAEYAYRFCDQLSLWLPPSEILDQIKSLLSLREHIVEQVTANKSALKAVQRKHYKNQMVEDIYLEAINLGGKQVKLIEKQIKGLLNDDDSFRHKVKLLLSVPGVGLLLACNLMVITEGFSKAVNYKQLNAYAGICPFEKQSGSSLYRRPRSKRVGPGKLRKLLYLASLSVRTHNPEFRRYFLRKTNQGKNSRLVLNNIANKIIKISFAVVHNNKPFIDNYNSINPCIFI